MHGEGCTADRWPRCSRGGETQKCHRGSQPTATSRCARKGMAQDSRLHCPEGGKSPRGRPADPLIAQAAAHASATCSGRRPPLRRRWNFAVANGPCRQAESARLPGRPGQPGRPSLGSARHRHCPTHRYPSIAMQDASTSTETCHGRWASSQGWNSFPACLRGGDLGGRRYLGCPLGSLSPGSGAGHSCQQGLGQAGHRGRARNRWPSAPGAPPTLAPLPWQAPGLPLAAPSVRGGPAPGGPGWAGGARRGAFRISADVYGVSHTIF